MHRIHGIKIITPLLILQFFVGILAIKIMTVNWFISSVAHATLQSSAGSVFDRPSVEQVRLHGFLHVVQMSRG
jgi:hypothetical protein